jgi:hypothetical protein
MPCGETPSQTAPEAQDAFLPEAGIQALCRAIEPLEATYSRVVSLAATGRWAGDWICITLAGLDGRPFSRLLMTAIPPVLPCRKLTGPEAARQARLWLQLRRRGEVDASPAWLALLLDKGERP